MKLLRSFAFYEYGGMVYCMVTGNDFFDLKRQLVTTAFWFWVWSLWRLGKARRG